MIESARLLFLVVDPFGNLPVALAVTRDTPVARYRRVILRETLIALLVLALAYLIFRLGRRGMSVREKFMGLLLNLVAVNMILVGIRDFLAA